MAAQPDDPQVAPVASAPAHVEDAVAPPPGNPRFPLLDGLRGLSVISIVAVHTAITSQASYNGWFGTHFLQRLEFTLPVFFALSGFLLYRPFVAARAGAPTPRLPIYLFRRALRIFPAYWVAIVVYAIFFPLPGLYSGDWWVYALLLGPFTFLYNGVAMCNQDICVFGPAWSISCEVTLYVLLPFYAAFVAWLAGRRSMARWLRVELIAMTVLSLITVGILIYETKDPLPRAWLNITAGTTAMWFMVGMGLAVASVAISMSERKSRVVDFLERRSWLGWPIALAIFIALCSLMRPDFVAQSTGERVLWYVGQAVMALLIVAPAVFAGHRRDLPQRILAWKPIAWLGLISYGIFLWHSLAMFLIYLDWGSADWIKGHAFVVLTICTLALSIVMAAISYYVLERPLLRLKYERLPWRPRGGGAPAAAAPTR